jgi:hypothetical protein
MHQQSFFNEIPVHDSNISYIGHRLYIKFSGDNKSRVSLFHNDVLVKSIDLSDSVAKRLFIVDAIELGAMKSHLAEALGISRQSIDNYLNAKRYFGLEGLINNYSPTRSKNIRKQRLENISKRGIGNKTDIIEEIRQKEQEGLPQQTELVFGQELMKDINSEDQPFTEEHDWEPSRYAGVFPYLITLIHLNDWLEMVIRYFGDKYKIFLAFLLLFAKGLRSIEQVKNIFRRDAGLVLGIRRMPIRQQLRGWLYSACKMGLASQLLQEYFRKQVITGKVATWLWFTDGHLLPYTGKQKTHLAFNTQRQMVVPGRTNQVSCDINGKVVDFEIQEGKGDMRTYLVSMGQKWQEVIEEGPVMVFDREGYGAEFFYNMNQAGVAFVTWEKHIDTKKINDIQPDQFKEEFEVNGRTYRVFEDEKVFTHTVENEKISFALRRINIWNVTTNRRTCALSNTGFDKMNTQQCATAILNRWGASENTFKHMADRHPLNYQPGYEFFESEKQLIVNPELKQIKRELNLKKKNLEKLCKKLSKSSQVFNKDGSIRDNSKHQRLKNQIHEEEIQIQQLNEKYKQLPQKIDTSSLEDYKCFQRISDESKYLFDFVTSSAWNARKKMVEWLSQYFDNKNECVDLFYAITNSHGWIKSDNQKVIVRIEPVQQPSRRSAQIQFCRKLNELAVTTPSGKLLQIEVGHSPFK